MSPPFCSGSLSGSGALSASGAASASGAGAAVSLWKTRWISLIALKKALPCDRGVDHARIEEAVGPFSRHEIDFLDVLSNEY